MSCPNPLTAEQLLARLAQDQGCIVSSGCASHMEINDARQRGDFYVDADGFGYILRSKDWRQLAEASITQVRTEHVLPKPPDGYRWDENNVTTLRDKDDAEIGTVVKSASGWVGSWGEGATDPQNTRDDAAFILLGVLGFVAAGTGRSTYPDVTPA